MVEGRHFRLGSAQFVPARVVRTDGGTLRVEGLDGAVLTEAPIRRVRISSRLGRTVRRLDFPDGTQFATEDNDGVDGLLLGQRHRSAWADRIERSLRWVAIAFAVSLLSTFAFLRYGIPLLARALAAETPRSVVVMVSRESLRTLDHTVLAPSKLTGKDKARARMLIRRVARDGANGADPYVLQFRSAPLIGPNAFALPDGTIVMTDQLWPYIHADGELEGVFAHEMSHVDRRHGLQSIYQAAIVPATIALVTGDASQITQMATILPGILVQSAYSRHFEQQADDDAAARLIRARQDPGQLAHLLQRLDAKFCGKNGCGPSWLGDHPLTADRVARLLSESRAGRRSDAPNPRP